MYLANREVRTKQARESLFTPFPFQLHGPVLLAPLPAAFPTRGVPLTQLYCARSLEAFNDIVRARHVVTRNAPPQFVVADTKTHGGARRTARALRFIWRREQPEQNRRDRQTDNAFEAVRRHRRNSQQEKTPTTTKAKSCVLIGKRGKKRFKENHHHENL